MFAPISQIENLAQFKKEIFNGKIYVFEKSKITIHLVNQIKKKIGIDYSGELENLHHLSNCEEISTYLVANLKNTEIFKERRLPLKGQVKSKTGDIVKPDDVIANTDLPGNVQMINVANLLNADASDIENYMIKGKGESIEKDDLLAETKGLFGFFKSSVPSHVSGKI